MDAKEENNLVDGSNDVKPVTPPTLDDQGRTVAELEDQSYSQIALDHLSTSENVPVEGKQNPSMDDAQGVTPSRCGQTNELLYEMKAEQSESEELADEQNEYNEKRPATASANGMLENKSEGFYSPDQREPVTPNSFLQSSAKAIEESSVNEFEETKMSEYDETGTLDEQMAFMKELESFYKERSLEFKPPKFYGQPLNCLKLWRAVINLGGYDRVTGAKLWRQVGESFHPPKTCTTVSWTFRIFYEKILKVKGEEQCILSFLYRHCAWGNIKKHKNEALLEYERHKCQTGELQFPPAALPETSIVEHEANVYQTPGSGRARRDAAARAMQGWHVQRLTGYGEVGEPIVKDKSLTNMPKREKNLKSIGSLKHKRQNELEHAVKAARTESSKQLVTTVMDVGPPADWVKINVQETKDCFEVYALVPGLLREEVRVQSDPAGRLVITGQPEHAENPWGITPFQKVVSLPARIDPLQTSAVVSLHGRLFVRVPFEQA